MAKEHMFIFVNEQAVIIGAAMDERCHHAYQVVTRPRSNKAADTAHWC
jgi:hypothetical protein